MAASGISAETARFCVSGVKDLPSILRAFFQGRKLLLEFLVVVTQVSSGASQGGLARMMTVGGLSQDDSLRINRSWPSGDIAPGSSAIAQTLKTEVKNLNIT